MHAESGAAAVQRLVHWHWKLVVIISSGGARRVRGTLMLMSIRDGRRDE